jgi:hypothetical protein
MFSTVFVYKTLQRVPFCTYPGCTPFQDCENDLKVMTGVEVGHSTHHRQVKKADLSPPNVKQKLTEVCLDGGKAGTQAHIDAIMSVFRRSVWDELQKII